MGLKSEDLCLRLSMKLKKKSSVSGILRSELMQGRMVYLNMRRMLVVLPFHKTIPRKLSFRPPLWYLSDIFSGICIPVTVHERFSAVYRLLYRTLFFVCLSSTPIRYFGLTNITVFAICVSLGIILRFSLGALDQLRLDMELAFLAFLL